MNNERDVARDNVRSVIEDAVDKHGQFRSWFFLALIACMVFKVWVIIVVVIGFVGVIALSWHSEKVAKDAVDKLMP